MGFLSKLFGRSSATPATPSRRKRQIPDEGWARVTDFKAHYYVVEREPPDWVSPGALCGRDDLNYDMYTHWYCDTEPALSDRCKACQKALIRRQGD